MNSIKSPFQSQGDSGIFRHKSGFTVTSNDVVRDKTLSMKAKGLYTIIRSWITLDSIVLSKEQLRNQCLEKAKAFDSAWDELKQHGYLKIHVIPSEHGRFLYEYELLESAELRDGVYLYRYDRSSNITSTNLGPAVPESPKPDYYPQNGTTGDRTPLLRGSAKHTTAKRSSANGGGKVILTNNPENKTEYNHSLLGECRFAKSKKPLSEEDQQAQVATELAEKKAIPYHYALQHNKMRLTINYLCEYDFRQQHPYMNEARQNAFNLYVDCLAEMACDQKQQSYRGALVTYGKVIDTINANANGCEEGGLGEFTDAVLEDFAEAERNSDIHSIRKYMKSVIWNCFSTYKVKMDAYVAQSC